MKRRKKILSPAVTMLLFAAAVLMLLGSSIGGARAALTYYSETYVSRIQLFDIGVTLNENGTEIAERTYSTGRQDGTWDGTEKGKLLEHMLENPNTGEEEPLKLGKSYQEELTVSNSGTINEFVRVTIYKYWVDKDGNKLTHAEDPEHGLSPDLIRLRLTNVRVTEPNPAWKEGRDVVPGTEEWLEDATARTEERTVLYYNKLLYCQKERDAYRERYGTEAPASMIMESPLFADQLTIDDDIAEKITTTESTETINGKTCTTITTTYDYDGAQFRVEVQVDAVQEHNAVDAIWSAWGRHVTVTDGMLTLD